MYTSGNVTVMVSDWEKALRFYTEILGMELRFESERNWAEVSIPGMTIGLHLAGKDTPPPGAGGALSIGLQVVDIAAAAATLKERGVTIGHEVDDGPVKLAFFQDPDGNPLYLCQVAAGPGA